MNNGDTENIGNGEEIPSQGHLPLSTVFNFHDEWSPFPNLGLGGFKTWLSPGEEPAAVKAYEGLHLGLIEMAVPRGDIYQGYQELLKSWGEVPRKNVNSATIQ